VYLRQAVYGFTRSPVKPLHRLLQVLSRLLCCETPSSRHNMIIGLVGDAAIDELSTIVTPFMMMTTTMKMNLMISSTPTDLVGRAGSCVRLRSHTRQVVPGPLGREDAINYIIIATATTTITTPSPSSSPQLASSSSAPRRALTSKFAAASRLLSEFRFFTSTRAPRLNAKGGRGDPSCYQY
jgi:hypothetical protein